MLIAQGRAALFVRRLALCIGRGARFPTAFLGRTDDGCGESWRGTLVRDEYTAYERLLGRSKVVHG